MSPYYKYPFFQNEERKKALDLLPDWLEDNEKRLPEVRIEASRNRFSMGMLYREAVARELMFVICDSNYRTNRDRPDHALAFSLSRLPHGDRNSSSVTPVLLGRHKRVQTFIAELEEIARDGDDLYTKLSSCDHLVSSFCNEEARLESGLSLLDQQKLDDRQARFLTLARGLGSLLGWLFVSLPILLIITTYFN